MEQGPGPREVRLTTSRPDPTPAAAEAFRSEASVDRVSRQRGRGSLNNFERPSTSLSNADAADSLPVSLNLALCCAKSGADEAR
jgi:hypothetical protein